MLDAHAHASRLHRDISIGNIVLVREQNSSVRKGHLVDWDASCDTDDAGKALDVGRVVRIMYILHNSVCCSSLSTGYLDVHVEQGVGSARSYQEAHAAG